MQPQYDIRWSEAFVVDVTAICGQLSVFEKAFEGYPWLLRRLPRGPGTWDLSPLGDFRIGRLEACRLEDGAEVPTIYFTFQLHLGADTYLELLRAFRSDDDALAAFAGPEFQPQS
jgi:hypothetical protein